MVITNNPESSIYIFEDPVETNVSTKQAQLLSLGLTFCSFAFECFNDNEPDEAQCRPSRLKCVAIDLAERLSRRSSAHFLE